MKLTRAGVLILAAVSVPISLELRTFFGFFDIEVPLLAVVVLEVLFLLAVVLAYDMGQRSSSAN